MNLNDLRNKYENNTIQKNDFIDQTHLIHQSLFQYIDFIKNTDISKIEINDDGVFFTTRRIAAKFCVDMYDKRITPLETLNFRDYEPEDMDMIIKIIQERLPKDSNILDIGGNVGWYSIHLAKIFRHAIINTFEPIPKTYSYLTKNLEMNDIKNVNAHNFGFSNEDKTLDFYYYKEGSGNASIANLSEQKDIEKIECRIRVLDEFINENKMTVDFIKCDVEGAELFVFQGAKETLKKQRPIVFTEMLRKWAKKFNYHPNDIISFFKSIDYNCYVSENHHLKPFHEVDEDTKETNYFFIHRDRI